MSALAAVDSVVSTDELTCIYALCDPRDGAVRYIGKAIDPEKRLRQHLRGSAKTRKNSWIKSLQAEGLQPEMEILIRVPLADANETECAFIEMYRSIVGDRLTNGTSGGDGWSGPLSDTHRANIAAALQGKRKSSEHAHNISKGRTGIRMSEEGRAKIRAERKRRGWKASRAAIEAATAKTSGVPRTEEVRRRISEAKRGKPYPQGSANPRNAAKVTVEQVQAIRLLHEQGIAVKDLAGRFGINTKSVYNIVRFVTWRHVGNPNN